MTAVAGSGGEAFIAASAGGSTWRVSAAPAVGGRSRVSTVADDSAGASMTGPEASTGRDGCARAASAFAVDRSTRCAGVTGGACRCVDPGEIAAAPGGVAGSRGGDDSEDASPESAGGVAAASGARGVGPESASPTAPLDCTSCASAASGAPSAPPLRRRRPPRRPRRLVRAATSAPTSVPGAASEPGIVAWDGATSAASSVRSPDVASSAAAAMGGFARDSFAAAAASPRLRPPSRGGRGSVRASFRSREPPWAGGASARPFPAPRLSRPPLFRSAPGPSRRSRRPSPRLRRCSPSR